MYISNKCIHRCMHSMQKCIHKVMAHTHISICIYIYIHDMYTHINIEFSRALSSHVQKRQFKVAMLLEESAKRSSSFSKSIRLVAKYRFAG